jgi:osmotically-inducible protein OsmY
MGTVESLAEKVQCERVVSGVRGVRAVENRVRVDYEQGRPDAEIRRDVRKALRWDALVDHGLVLVDVERGKVILDGTVGSAAEKDQARRDAWVSGVRSVDASGLEVAPWAERADLRKDKYLDLADAAVAEAVKTAVESDPRVRSAEVEPEVDEGVVTLRGVVGHVRARRAAEADARNTVGVVSVVNRIKVRPEDRPDEAMEQEIRSALKRDPALEPYDLDVSVIGGKAYLYGEVSSYYEKGLADNVASRARGLDGVRNFIEVNVPGPLTYDPYTEDYYPYTQEWYEPRPRRSLTSDEEILEEVREELWWSPFVDEEQVEVTVDGGTVVLTGTVETPGEKRVAAENAWEGGATWVRNQLRVKE